MLCALFFFIDLVCSRITNVDIFLILLLVPGVSASALYLVNIGCSCLLLVCMCAILTWLDPLANRIPVPLQVIFMISSEPAPMLEDKEKW